jgi:adenylate cyclase
MAAKLSAQAVEICSEFDIPYWRDWAGVVAAWGQVEKEGPDAGTTAVRNAYEIYSGLGSNFCLSFFSSLLAERLAGAGELEEGLEAARRALDIAEATGERWWQAETYRIHGRLLVASSLTDDAAHYYDSGLTLARRQGSSTLALRCAIDLCLLWQSQGRETNTREFLTQLLASFDGAFVTPEVEDARDLLEALSD